MSGWSVRRTPHGESELLLGPPVDGTRLVIVDPFIGRMIADAHNAELAERPSIGNLEEFATRVLAGAMRELLREARPRWWRRVTDRLSPGGDKPVYAERGSR